MRAALWTVRAVRIAKRQLGDGDDYRALDIPPPPSLAAHGEPRDLVIGVKPPAEGFAAHAWREGDPESSAAGFTELTRVPAR